MPQDEQPQSKSRLHELLEEARRQLVETGTRNRLIHVNRSNKRSSSLNIINEHSDDVFNILRVNSRKMKFKATGKDRSDEHDDVIFEEGGNDLQEESRNQGSTLETPLDPDALEKRLLRLLADAKTAEEEQGVNILFLSMGFLTWFEDRNSSIAREAPLILLPVELVRNERGSIINIRSRDDDIVANLPLQERFKEDFGIILPDIDDSEPWTPEQYFEQVSDVVSEKEDWKIDRDGMQIGFFSFSKFLMMRDLDPKNWPGGSLQNSDLVQRLLQGGFNSEPPLFGPDDRLDERLNPEDIIQVVDADSSQTKAIEEVRAGRNLVVQGPPGTGKSQTITNIIAAAVHDGKSVLFMAEKMAALDVVHNRLVKVGLRDLCLELHSKNANKKSVLQELGRTLHAGRSVSCMPDNPAKLRVTRDRLNKISNLLHQPLPGRDYTTFSIISEISGFIGKNVPPPTLKGDGFAELSESDRRRLTSLIRDYVTILSRSGPRKSHPFYGVTKHDLQPTDLQRLSREARDALDAISSFLSINEEVAATAGVSTVYAISDSSSLRTILDLAIRSPKDIFNYGEILLYRINDNRLSDALNVGLDWRKTRDSAASLFSEPAWETPVENIRIQISKGVTSFFHRIFGKYRSASAEFGSSGVSI